MSSLKEILNCVSCQTVFRLQDCDSNATYDVDISQVLNFYVNYCNDKTNNWNSEDNFAEIVDNNMPLITEFVFPFHEKIDIEDGDNYYDEEFIENLIRCHHDTIRKFGDVKDDCRELVCVVLEAGFWEGDNVFCCALKLQFPYCVFSQRFIKDIFRDKVLQNLYASGILKDFTKTLPRGDWNNWLQPVRLAYPLYGSKDRQIKSKYTFQNIYGIVDDDIIIMDIAKDIFDIRKHSFYQMERCIVDDITMFEDAGDAMDNQSYYEYLLPFFLSMFYWSGLMIVSKKFEREITPKQQSDKIHIDEEVKERDIDLCKTLLSMLPDSRLKDMSSLMEIGRALINSDKFEGKSIFKQLCLKKGLMEEEDCDDLIEDLRGSHITWKTIAWYAKKDNYERFRAWHHEWSDIKMKEALCGDDIPIAQAFYRKYFYRFMTSSKNWFIFQETENNGRLIKLEKNYEINRCIQEEFKRDFFSYQSELALKIMELSSQKGNKEKIDLLQDMAEKCLNVIKKLQKGSFVKSVVEASKDYFHVRDLENVLNSNPQLFGCVNCVIELGKEEAIVRDGKPEDFLTTYTDTPYEKKYNDNSNHKDLRLLNDYLRKVFVDHDLREFVKKDVASMLCRENREKIFRLWIGTTNGSKSVFQYIITRMLGPRAGDLNESFYSSKRRGGSGPDPELAQLKDKNVVFTGEPTESNSFQGAVVKRITGGTDSMFVRGCGSDGGSIRINFKPIVLLNIVPNIDGFDEATKGRMSFLPFGSRFVTDKPSDRKLKERLEKMSEEEMYKERLFYATELNENEIKRIASALLWTAVKYYKNYVKEGLRPPHVIEKFIDDYWKENDLYIKFIGEFLERPLLADKTIDMAQSTTVADVYYIFKKWYAEEANISWKDVPSKNKFKDFMESYDRLGKTENGKWYGWIIIEKEIEVC